MHCLNCKRPCHTGVYQVQEGNNPWRWHDETRSLCCACGVTDQPLPEDCCEEDELIYADDLEGI